MYAIYKPQTRGCLGSIWVAALQKKSQKAIYKYPPPSAVIGSKRYQRKACQIASSGLVYISFPFVLCPRVSFFPEVAVPSTAHSGSMTHLSLGDSRFTYSHVTICAQKVYLLTYLFTPWSRVPLEKLASVCSQSRNSPHFYETRKFFTVLTSARHPSLS
jgi:hypothetical protein